MNNTEFRYIDGTSALEPDCSRYSNENERIISFERAASKWKGEADYGRISHAMHVKPADRLMASAINIADKSTCLHEIRTGNLKGTPFGIDDVAKVKAYGCLYALAALATILATTL